MHRPWLILLTAASSRMFCRSSSRLRFWTISERGDLLGDVLVRHHPAEAGRIDMGGFDGAAAMHQFAALGAGAAAIAEQLRCIGCEELVAASGRDGCPARPTADHLLERHALDGSRRREKP